MTKSELRKLFKSVRREVEDSDLKAHLIADRLFANEIFKSCDEVFLYCNSDTEVSTSGILNVSLSLGKRVAYPKCTDKGGNMEFQLKKLRKSRNISQLKLALDLNMNQNSISRYENGEREADYATLIKFADYFNVSLDELLGRYVNEKQEQK